MLRRSASILLFAASLACSATSPTAATPTTTPPEAPTSRAEEPAATTTRIVVLVRHGEKVDDSTDAALAEAGHARAQCLARMFDGAAVTDVLATELRRTRDTVAPLARDLGEEVEVLPAADGAGWVARLRALPPEAIAVAAGHGNTIPDMVLALTGQRVAIEHDEYDRMFVIALGGDGRGSMLAMRYCSSQTGSAAS